MKQVLNSFAIAIAMYSKIPIKTSNWEKSNMKYVMCFFPVVGLFIGLGILLWTYLITLLPFGSAFRTAGYILIPIMITGGIHLDGLLDTADALSSYQTIEKKLEILKDPHTGAFAIIVFGCYLLSAYGIWSEVSNDMILVIALGFILSRALSGYAVVTFPCAKNSGLAALFSDAASKRVVKKVMLLQIVLTNVAMLLIHMKYGMFAILGAFVVFIYYKRMSRKQFGGITGDVAGFFLQLCEVIMVLSIVVGDKIW
ncbi:MAG: adenosylcobinamide-GDP ribazoletransferase [Anaerocolumna sp.]